MYICKKLLLTKNKKFMKNRKKSLILFFAVIIAIPALNSCKKGSEDPFLSLKTRKARLTGEWVLQSGTETTTYGTSTYSATYTNTTVTYTWGGNSTTYAYSETVEFNKDNTFKTTIMEDGDIGTCEGYWAFMNGYEDVKNKECVVLRFKSCTEGGGVILWTGDEMPEEVLRFEKLSNKEAVIVKEGTGVEGGDTYTYNESKTYSKE